MNLPATAPGVSFGSLRGRGRDVAWARSVRWGNAVERGGARHPPRVSRPAPRVPRAMAYSAGVTGASVPVRAARLYQWALDFGVRIWVA